MAESNEYKVVFGADVSDAVSKIEQLTAAVEKLSSSMSGNMAQMSNNVTSSISKFSSSMATAGAALSVGLTAPLVLFGKSALQTAAEMEQITIAFEVFTGSAQVAGEMLTELKDQALKSPMQFQDFAKGAQTLLGYGVAAKNVTPITGILGDISAGNADKFARLSLAYGQVTAAGRLMGQEARQMINAGFNPLQSIADKTGKSMAQLTKDMKDGKISVRDVTEAMIDATSEGGRFFGMADKQSKTLAGAYAKMGEQIKFTLAEVGNKIAESLDLTNVITKVSVFISFLKDKFMSLSPATQDMIIKISMAAAAIGPLLIALAGLGKALSFVQGGISSFVTILGGGLPVIAAAAVALIGLAYATDYYNNSLKKDAIWNNIDALQARNKEILKSIELGEKDLKNAKAMTGFPRKTMGGVDLDLPKETLITNARNNLNALRIQLIENNNRILELKKNMKTVDVNELLKNLPTATGLEGTGKKKKEGVETIPGTDFITTEEGNKIKRLIQLNKDASKEIEEIWLDGTAQKLAKLKADYEIEIQDYIKYQVDYTNITAKYEATRKKIIDDAERERQANAIRSHQAELEGLKMTYPKQIGDFAKDLLDNDVTNKLSDYGKSFYAASKDMAINIAAGFAEIVGTALVSGGSVGDAFKALGSLILNSLGDYLIKIGTSAIAAGVVGTILKSFFTGGAATVPELGIAGGMAAVAVGGAMKALAGKVDASMDKNKGGAGTSMTSSSSSVASRASGSTYQYGGSNYSQQSVRLFVDLTGSITQTSTGYAINKSMETTLRITGR